MRLIVVGLFVMLAYAELRDHLIQFLGGDLPLDGFEDWFVQRSWNMHKDSDLYAQRLAYAVELRLAEHNDGHLSETDLQSELRHLVNSVPVSESPNVIISTGSSTQLNFPALAWSVPFVDMPRATASELPTPR